MFHQQPPEIQAQMNDAFQEYKDIYSQYISKLKEKKKEKKQVNKMYRSIFLLELSKLQEKYSYIRLNANIEEVAKKVSSKQYKNNNRKSFYIKYRVDDKPLPPSPFKSSSTHNNPNYNEIVPDEVRF